MLDDILNPRRAPRVPARFPVEIRHRLSVWNGETEDIGPRGCQVVTPRVLDPGRDVKLAIRCEGLERTLLAQGRVVWMRANAPVRLGIAFQLGTVPPDWFDRLMKGSLLAARAARIPDRLPRLTRVYLGKAPEVVVDFTMDELDVLQRVGEGVTLDALARSFGPEMGDRTRGALFALLARRCLVLDPTASPGAATWRRVLAGRESDLPRPGEAAERALGAGRPPEAQRLYDEALGYIGSGRLSLAMERLRDALQHAPGDAVIASTAKRIGRWAS
jgi:hypothetical protein